MSIYRSTVKPILRRVKAALTRPVEWYLYGSMSRGPKAIRLGSSYGSFDVIPDRLGPESTVYCFGIGEDISFDLELIRRFGCTVHAFDPTPRSLEWVKRQNPPKELVVHGFGLSDKDGSEAFAPPEDSSHVSHSFMKGAPGSRFELPVHKLSTIASMLGHSRVDLLKMDVEGAEYVALDDILGSGIPVTQIAIEFHEQMVGLVKARRQIQRLKAHGYRLAAINRISDTVTFERLGSSSEK